ncbi:uncharacterized protein LOC110464142 [Mizuhopecten yessoensis]|uniref:Carbohydrate sulfotransferase 6 n=1 Tax=Mizuhopecten yessoensis TaxID=6573 RepID=A0A210PUN0_MIZYE|nr:uncharacterized protein LOC110464142 [Mizuhopecten yessoensis]OWF40162.1 Carbohydrate sulfotransferase 6 [Mizuhopecten yessoensis]
MKSSVSQHTYCPRISRKVKRYMFLCLITVTSIAVLVVIGKKNLVYSRLFKNGVFYFDSTVYDGEPDKQSHGMTSTREQIWATTGKQGLGDVRSNAQTMSPNYNVRGMHTGSVNGDEIEAAFIMADNEQSSTQNNYHKYVVPNAADVSNVRNTWKKEGESFNTAETIDKLDTSDTHQNTGETDSLRQRVKFEETDITEENKNDKSVTARHAAIVLKKDPVSVQNQNDNVVGKVNRIENDAFKDNVNPEGMIDNLLDWSDNVNLENLQGKKNIQETLNKRIGKNTQKTQNTKNSQNTQETEHTQGTQNTQETKHTQGTQNIHGIHNKYETQNAPEETINILDRTSNTQSKANNNQSDTDNTGVNMENGKDAATERDMNKEESHTHVLLLTYLRSGSTLTADIIQQVPGVFYTYEPLKPYLQSRTVKRPEDIGYFTMNGICSISNSSCRPPRQTSEQTQMIVADIVRFYSCDLTHFNRAFMWSHYGKAVAQYHMCVKTSAKLKTRKEICLKQCFESTKSIKTIRLSMDIVETLLQKVTNLKVVHLLRDPRGMIYSRKRGGFVKPWMNLTTVARSVCERFERDIEVAMKLKQKYPGRLKTYLYEQIAEHPKSASDSLFNFLGLAATDNFNMWLHNHTAAGNRSSYYGTSRPNSTITASAWRLKMPYKEVTQIDSECTKYYKYAGILTANSTNALTDLSFQLRSNSPLFGDFL